MLFTAGPAQAALPPLELVQQALAADRLAGTPVRFDLRVTETQDTLTEWTLFGEYAYGDATGQIGPAAAVPRRLLWIALLAPDPVAALQPFGALDRGRATVGVQDDFVYVYGGVPGISVFRDLRRLAAFSVNAAGHRWVTRLSWAGEAVVGVMITRDGQTVLTAHARTARPSSPGPGRD